MHSLNFPLVFVDTEYTTFGPTRATGWPEAHHHKEIVQIAAVKVQDLLDTAPQTFDIKVKPTLNPQVTQFFIELTWLSQELIDQEGTTFEKALEQFVTFVGWAHICTFDQDRSVFDKNCELNGIANPFSEEEFFRIKGQLPAWWIDPDNYSSGTLYQAIDADMHGHVHNALHDVLSMSAFTQEMIKRNI